MTKVLEFLRVSTQDQSNDDRAGLPRQSEANIRTIQKHGLSVVKKFVVVDVSGTSVMRTPEIKEMIFLMQSPDIRGVVVADWDRLIRLDNFSDFSLLQNFKETNTLIYLPDQVIDLNTQSGFLIGGFQSIISGNELTQIKKRMLEAKEIKRKKGEHPNCHINLPYAVSYDKDLKKFHYTDEINRIEKLFSLFYNSRIQNYRELERLTGFKHRTIYNLLRNEIYAGYRTYTQKRGAKYLSSTGRQTDRKKINRSDDEIIRVKVIDKPIVQMEIFLAVQDTIRRKNTEYHKQKSKEGEKFLYSGFLKCGVCGQMMYSVSGGRNHKKDYYVCRGVRTEKYCGVGYLPKEMVESTITSFAAEILTDTEYLLQLVETALSKEKETENQKQIELVSSEIKKLENNKYKLLDLYRDGIFSRDELNMKASEFNENITVLKIQLSELQTSQTVRYDESVSNIIKTITLTLSEFPYWTPLQKRSYLRSQIPFFHISRSGIEKAEFNLNCVCKLGNRMDRGSWRQSA